MKRTFLSLVAISSLLLACAGEDPEPGGEGREADIPDTSDVPPPTEEDMGEPLSDDDSRAEDDAYGLIYYNEFSYASLYYGGKFTSYNQTPFCQKNVYPWSYGSSHCQYLGYWSNRYQYDCYAVCYI